MKNHFGEFKNYTNPTIKKCVPVLDSLTSGYLILNPAEVAFTQEKDQVIWNYKPEVHDIINKLNIGIQTHNTNQISKDIKNYHLI